MATETEDLIRLSFFTDMARAIAEATTLSGTLREVMNQIGRVFAPRNWSLLLRDPKTDELVFAVVTGGDGVEQLRNVRLPRGTGIAGWIAEHGEPVIIEDVDKDERFDPSMDQLTQFKTESIIGVPLRTSSRVFGVIELINKLNGQSFSPLDLKVLVTIADFAAIAIEKAYYFNALKKIATVDSLTGLYNRRSFVRTLDRELGRCARHHTSLAALMLDVDSFKQINDTHGHAEGDRVLRDLANVLSSNVRDIDVVSRYGGDEFIVLMPEADLAAAEKVKTRVEHALREGRKRDAVEYSVSIGCYGGCPESPEELFRGADLQLYREKDRKRDETIEEMTAHLAEFLVEDEEQ